MEHWKSVVLSVFFISCHPSAILTEAEKTKIVEEIKWTLSSYQDDIRQSGLTAELKYLDHSSDFLWVPPGYSSAIHFDSVSGILNRSAPGFKSIVNKFDELEITPLKRDLASYTGKMRSVVIDTAGKSTTMKLIETGILIKRAEGWKLLQGQTAIIGN